MGIGEGCGAVRRTKTLTYAAGRLTAIERLTLSASL